MELRLFQDRIFGKYENQLFVWENAWDSFRPIERIGWNGKSLEIVDTSYKQNIFDPNYGYGNMKELCKTLTEETELSHAKEDPYFWKWTGLSPEWWKDRLIVFATKCISRDTESWKKYIRYSNSKQKTLKQKANLSHTKRLIKH